MVKEILDRSGMKLKPKVSAELRKHNGELTAEKAEDIISSMTSKKASAAALIQVNQNNEICRKYLAGMNAGQMTAVVGRRWKHGSGTGKKVDYGLKSG